MDSGPSSGSEFFFIPLVGGGGRVSECHTSPIWGGVCKTCLLTCLGALRTSALCLETEKKKERKASVIK